MLAAQRHAIILEEIERHGAVRVSDLTRRLGVSDMTVRRDLDVLERRGLVDKVHGGATASPTQSTLEPGFEAKRVRNLPEKAAIAREAVRLVEPGIAVGLSAGTTAWTLAWKLRDVPGLTIVTNSIQVATVLHGGTADQTVILTGGVRTPSDALVGPIAVSALRQLHLDLTFLGVHGMGPRSGFTTPNMMEADTDRAMIEATRRLVVIADHSKWGEVGITTIARLGDAHTLVTDEGLPRRARSTLSEHVSELVIASVSDEAAS